MLRLTWPRLTMFPKSSVVRSKAFFSISESFALLADPRTKEWNPPALFCPLGGWALPAHFYVVKLPYRRSRSSCARPIDCKIGPLMTVDHPQIVAGAHVVLCKNT